jgi:glycosyltransferase involved in cell wall biosynthesis
MQKVGSIMPNLTRTAEPAGFPGQVTGGGNLLLWHWGRRGGGPRYTYELAKALKDGKYCNVHLSLSRQSEIFDETAALNLPGFHVDTYSDPASAALALLRLPFIRRNFWRYVRDNKITTIICTMSHIWNYPVLLGRPDSSRYVLVLHDVLPHQGDDKPVRRVLLDREVEASDWLVTLTQYTRDLAIEHNHYAADRISVIPHGVFPYLSSASAQRPAGDLLQLLFFGRLMPYKGLDLLLDAYRLLKARQVPVALRIVGPGSVEPYTNKLSGLADVFCDIRWIPEEEVGPAFESADIVVLPYREASQSGVIATAFAGGLPVVATPVGGLVEQVKHEESGLLTDTITPEALAASIERLVVDPQLRERCGKGALMEAERTLSWTAIAQQFGELITQVDPVPTKSATR